MSNKRITDLTELTTPTTDDVFPVVDIATNTTTKVQLGNLPVPTSVTTALATKQDTLVSGTNIKTVNSTSLVGSGNVAVQETLVSGTNIKTLNSVSLLGSGNIVLAATPSGVAGAIQFSNGSAFASDAANLFWDDTNNRLGIGTNTPDTTAHFKGGVSGAVGTRIATFEGSLPEILFKDTSNNTGFAIAKYGGLVYFVNTNSSGAYSSYSGLTNSQGQWSFGGGFNPSGTVHIKGSGSTSATTSLLVQNSSGVSSLQVNDKGSVFNFGKGSIGSNTVFGSDALQANTTGSQNTVFGLETLYSNTTGLSNSAFGVQSMFFNTTGGNNTAMGVGALISNTTGSSNSALGVDTESGNFSGSVILGRAATATASNQFVVGSSSYNAGAIDSSAFTQDKRWKVKINGVDYYIALQTA